MKLLKDVKARPVFNMPDGLNRIGKHWCVVAHLIGTDARVYMKSSRTCTGAVILADELARTSRREFCFEVRHIDSCKPCGQLGCLAT